MEKYTLFSDVRLGNDQPLFKTLTQVKNSNDQSVHILCFAAFPIINRDASTIFGVVFNFDSSVLEFVQLQEVQVVTDEKDMVLFKVEDAVEGLKRFILQPSFHRLTRNINSKTTETEKSTNLATSAKNKEIKTPANKELRPTRQKITPKLGTQRAWDQYRTTEKEKKRNVKKPVKLQECVLLPRGAFPPPPVKTAPTSKKLGALKICKQNFKTEAAPPAPIQQNNYDSLPNSDVITVDML